MSVSVVIPNYESPIIDKTVASVLEQTISKEILEVLVVGVDSRRLVVEDDVVMFIRTDGPVSAPVARNIGIRQARGDYLVFIDADCIAAPTWLEELLKAQYVGWKVVGGSVRLRARDYWQLCYNITMFHEFLTSKSSGIRNNLGSLNLCLTREVVERVGLMDENLPRGQDTEWTLRMRRYGYPLFFTHSAEITHCPQVQGLGNLLRLWWRSGFFNGQVRCRYRNIIAPPPFAGSPFLLVLFSPLIALGVSLCIFARDLQLLHYLHTFPVVFLTKVAWCMGAARALREV